MASNTPNLNLYKKDPVVDGEDTFNIETMLNENWDKIDQTVATKAELEGIDAPSTTEFNQLSQTVTENQQTVNAHLAHGAHVPTGGIIMWSGATNTIPLGWQLCDGANGTPDLRNRFIVGAGGSYNLGDTGGASSVALTTAQLPSHEHSSGTLTTGSSGSHEHSYSLPRTSSSGGGDYNSASSTTTTNVNSFSTSSSGIHVHPISGSTASAGLGQSHENRPPYFALAFIMKV